MNIFYKLPSINITTVPVKIPTINRLGRQCLKLYLKAYTLDFPGGPVGKNMSANAGEMGLVTDVERSHMPLGSYTYVLKLLNLCSRTCAL